MLILAIDTSTRTGSIAFLRDGEVVAEISGHEETLYSTRLFRDLETLQATAQFRMDQIDVYAVVAGPGSFTGLRVGLTAVKAWAEVHDKPIAAISGLEAIAAQSEGVRLVSTEETVIAPFLDARRGQVFGALYRRETGIGSSIHSLVGESVFSAEEFFALVKANTHSARPVFVSPTPEVIPAALISQAFPNARTETVSPVLAPVVGRLGFERATRGKLIDALQLDANYVRRSDAEAAWKDS